MCGRGKSEEWEEIACVGGRKSEELVEMVIEGGVNSEEILTSHSPSVLGNALSRNPFSGLTQAKNLS